MKRVFGCVAMLLTLSLIFCTAPVFSENTPVKKEKKKLPQSGTLSMSGSAGFGSLQVPGTWGQKDDGASEGAPLSGSFSRINPKEWKASLSNTSKDDQYSASIRVFQMNQKGDKVKSDSYSVTLKPGEKDERTFRSHNSAVSGALELASWRKKSLAKPSPSASASPGAAGTTAAVTSGSSSSPAQSDDSDEDTSSSPSRRRK